MLHSKTDDKISFWDHLNQLKKIFLICIIALIGSASGIHFFRESVTTFLLQPLGDSAGPLQFLTPLDPLFFILKIDFTLGFFLIIPIIFFSIWWFLAPTTNIKTWQAAVLILSTSGLAMAGSAYAYYVVVPLVLSFMNSIVITGTVTAFTAHGYLQFLLSTAILLTLLFQIPVAIVILSLLQLINPNQIAQKRTYIYTAILIITAIITPTTDVITLALVCVPAIVVTEIGILVARVCVRNKVPLSGINHES